MYISRSSIVICLMLSWFSIQTYATDDYQDQFELEKKWVLSVNADELLSASIIKNVFSDEKCDKNHITITLPQPCYKSDTDTLVPQERHLDTSSDFSEFLAGDQDNFLTSYLLNEAHEYPFIDDKEINWHETRVSSSEDYISDDSTMEDPISKKNDEKTILLLKKFSKDIFYLNDTLDSKQNFLHQRSKLLGIKINHLSQYNIFCGRNYKQYLPNKLKVPEAQKGNIYYKILMERFSNFLLEGNVSQKNIPEISKLVREFFMNNNYEFVKYNMQKKSFNSMTSKEIHEKIKRCLRKAYRSHVTQN